MGVFFGLAYGIPDSGVTQQVKNKRRLICPVLALEAKLDTQIYKFWSLVYIGCFVS